MQLSIIKFKIIPEVICEYVNNKIITIMIPEDECK